MTPSSLAVFSNGTNYGIKSDGLRYIWTAYHICVMVSSLVGNSIVLLATIKYNALKLHKLIVSIIQHIAVCDLILSVTAVLPKVLALLADGWIFGNVLCHVMAYSMYYFNAVALLLICTLSTSKLLILKFPVRFRTLMTGAGHKICTGIWVTVLTINTPLMVLSAINGEIIFDYRVYACKYGWYAEFWKWLRPAMVVLIIAVPNLIVVATIVPLLLYLLRAKRSAKNSGKTQRWRGIMTVFFTVTIYCISILPYVAYTFIRKTRAAFVMDPHGYFENQFSRIVASFIFLNTLCNFYIYWLTIPSFRRFLWSRIQIIRNSVNTMLYQGNVNKLSLEDRRLNFKAFT